ncbi:MAG: hypothetical protein AAFV71_07275, partial [Cyanobacteria bacterium J06633_8]
YYFFINKRFKSLFFVGVVLKTVPIFLAVIKVKGLPCLRYTHLVTPSGNIARGLFVPTYLLWAPFYQGE